MKKPLLIIIILLLVGIGVAVFVKFPKTHTTNTKTQETQLSWDTEVMQSGDNQELTWNTITTGDENPLVYTNTEFWFQLTLPEWWEDYKAFVYLNNADNTASISIVLPTSEENRPWIPNPNSPSLDNYIKWYAEMYVVWILPTEKYQQEYDRCFPDPDLSCIYIINLLWNNNKYYFTSIWMQDMPTDLYTKRGDGANTKYVLPIFKAL